MKAPLLFVLLLLFFWSNSYSQNIIINELDSDTDGTDVLEFIELKTTLPNQSLDGYIIVMFSGNGDLSYYTIDLNGYTTDANGLFLMGNTDVVPTPSIIWPSNTLQNGQDAVAIYHASAADFPTGTYVTNTNLIDALVYDTDDPDDPELLSVLGKTVQINENEYGNKNGHSIQNNGDGTYKVGMPSPGLPNDGSSSETRFRITISAPNESYNEGDQFDITFTSDVVMDQDLTLTIGLTNGNFNQNDFTAGNSITIANGALSASLTVSTIDDSETEGDEFLKVYCSNQPSDVTIINNNYTIKIIDNDVSGSAWGTPLNPTYGMVTSTAVENYYSSLSGLAGQDLKNELQNIIADPNIVRAQNYGDVWDILKEADQDPDNNMAVWLLYSEEGRSKSLQQTSTTSVGTWNREHIYPQSRGGFSDGTSFYADGIDLFVLSNADQIEHGHSDAHALRASDYTENSIRSNKDYGEEYNGPPNNHGSWKGDVARSLFFMAIRYNGLDVVSGNPDNSTVGKMGDLDSLIVWHRQDPPDDFEMNRNNIVYNWQKNRNPFIDQPELAEYIWGNKVGQYWNASVGIDDPYDAFDEISIYPNPLTDQLNLKNIEFGEYQIFNILGEMMMEGVFNNYKIETNQLDPGIYFLEIRTPDKRYMTKFIKN